MGSGYRSSSGGAAGGADRECPPFILTTCARGDSSTLDAEETGEIARLIASPAPGVPSGTVEDAPAADLGFEGPGVSISASSSATWGFSSTKLVCGRFFFEAVFCSSSARWRPL